MAFIQTIFTAIVTFIATNIDDIFVLMMFFSQADGYFRRRHIVTGQYLGFIALLLISLFGFASRFIVPHEYIGILGLIPIWLGIRGLFQPDDDDDEIQLETPQPQNPVLQILLHPKTYSVTVVSFANGGDNLGVYTPLFASLKLSGLVVTVITFLAMVLLWCWLGMVLARQRQIAEFLQRYGKRIVPVVLIGLGIAILWENESWMLLERWFHLIARNPAG